jgi:hypothetical protein
MPAAPTKRALLIGINKYERVLELEGCTNDVQVMADLLRAKFDFTVFTTLLDEAATRAGILAALDAFEKSTQPGDIVAFYFAGHGSRIRDREGDKPSGWDCTLVPVDGTAHDGSGEGSIDITDDEIHAWLVELGAKTEHITLIVDACHSGNITRDADPKLGRTRGVPDDPRSAAQLPAPVTAAAPRGPAAIMGPSGWLPLGSRYVLIAGCRHDELSGELIIGDATPVHHGALTYYLSQTLAEASGPVTYRDLYERAASQVVAFREGKQHPQIEGTIDRKLFGTEDVRPMAYVMVRVREEGKAEATLAAGAALGATVGSRYAVYAPGTASIEGATSLGELEITSVGAFTSVAKVVSETAPDAIVASARAVLTRYAAGDRRLAVQLATTAGDAATALAKALADSPLVKVTTGDEPWTLRVQLAPARASAAAGDIGAELGTLAEATWIVTGTSGQVALPPKRESEWKAVADNLASRARYRIAMELRNPDPQSALAGKVTMELLRATSDTTWEVMTPRPEDGSALVIEDRDFVGVRVTNTHTADLWVNLLDFGVGGSISRLWPMEKGAQERLAAGKSVDVMTKPGERARFKLPDVFPFRIGGPGAVLPEGTETLRLFATTGETSFDFLETEGVRAGGAQSALQLLFETALRAPATREPEREPPIAKLDDWTTVDRSFVIRRKQRAELAGAPAVLTGVTVSASGATGSAQVASGKPSTAGISAPLFDALNESGVEVTRTITLDKLQGAANATGTPSVTLELAAPPRDMMQIIVTTDSAGGIRWHLPQQEAATRGAGDAPSVSQRFVLPVGSPTETGVATEAGTRGVTATGWVVKAASVLLAPVINPILGAVGTYAAFQWESKFRPYALRPVRAAQPTAIRDAEMTSDDWSRMAQGRALLLLHQPFGRAAGTFGVLPAAEMAKLDAAYGGRVFAFDHTTLSQDPLANAMEFVKRLPADVVLELDVLAVSRGGLVARVLAERQAELGLGARKVAIRRVALLGTPNAGSALFDPARIGTMVDVISTAICCVPGMPTTEVLDGIISTVKTIGVGAAKGLDGLMAMQVGSPFLKALNTGPRTASADTRYFAVSSNYTPSPGALLHLVADKSLASLFGEGHDLVVPASGTAGSNGSAMFPVADAKTLTGPTAVPHVAYLADPDVHAQLLQWLTA